MKKVILTILLVLPTIIVYAHPSWGIVVDENRNIYFADIMHNGRGSVWKLSNKGKLTLLLKDFHAHNVSLNSEGHLTTAHGEMDEHYMLKVYPDGKSDTLFFTSDYKEFNGGNAAYTPKGEIIFGAEKYFWRLKNNGEKEKISAHIFEWNQTIYADDEGNYYGSDIGDGKGKLIKVDSNGTSSIIAENLITQLDRSYDKHADVLMGITKGCDGNIYIAELAGRRIIKISPNNSPSTFYQSEINWIPTGIDFFSGDAYILEYKEKNGHAGPRIVKVDESGNTEIIFDYDSYQVNESKIIDSKEDEKNEEGNFWIISAILLTGFLLILLVVKSTSKNKTSSQL